MDTMNTTTETESQKRQRIAGEEFRSKANLDTFVAAMEVDSLEDAERLRSNPDHAAGLEELGLDNEGLVDLSARYFLDDVYDVRYLVGRTGEVISVRLTVAGGGPTIWVEVFDDGSAIQTFEWGGDVGESRTKHEYYARLFEAEVDSFSLHKIRH